MRTATCSSAPAVASASRKPPTPIPPDTRRRRSSYGNPRRVPGPSRGGLRSASLASSTRSPMNGAGMARLDPLRGAQLVRSRARVALAFLVTGDDHVLVEQAHAGGRAGSAAARQLAQAALDDAVLQRVERDDAQAAARAQAVGHLVEQSLDLRQLLVHGDAQRLEGARRRVLVPLVAGHGARDDRAERAGGIQLTAVARLDDRARD